MFIIFLSNEGDTGIFFTNYNDTIETFIYFAVMEDKTIKDQKVIIIANIKSQIIFPIFFVGSHEYELSNCSGTYNKHNGLSNGNICSRYGLFSNWSYQYNFDKSHFNRIHTHN